MMEEMGWGLPARRGPFAGFLFRAQASVERSVRALRGPAGEEIERPSGSVSKGPGSTHAGRRAGPPPTSGSPHVRHPFRTALVPHPDAGLPAAGPQPFPAQDPVGGSRRTSRVAGQWADAVGASIDGLFRDATGFST